MKLKEVNSERIKMIRKKDILCRPHIKWYDKDKGKTNGVVQIYVDSCWLLLDKVFKASYCDVSPRLLPVDVYISIQKYIANYTNKQTDPLLSATTMTLLIKTFCMLFADRFLERVNSLKCFGVQPHFPSFNHRDCFHCK